MTVFLLDESGDLLITEDGDFLIVSEDIVFSPGQVVYINFVPPP